MSFKKYQIKQHFLQFKPKYTITDHEGFLCATVNKHPFSFTKKATFYDDSGDERLTIFRKAFSFRATYFIHKDDKVIFKIWRTFGLKPELFVESLVESDAFFIQGNYWNSEYAFYRNNEEFAYVSRNIWNIRDVYGVAIKDDIDHEIILAIVVVIDLIRQSRKRKS